MEPAPPEVTGPDFLDIAWRFLAACEDRSFRPDHPNWSPKWQLEAALATNIEEAQRGRLWRTVLGADRDGDLAVAEPSEELQRRFVRAVGRQLHIFESWTMFQLQELVNWDGGMRRLKDGITCWTVPTLRCQLLPRKLRLQPLLLAKKWGLRFEHASGKLPGSLWSWILSFLAPPELRWFESPEQREAHPWWDCRRHPLVFPLFPSGHDKCVVGISLFLGEGAAEECMHRQQLVSLTLNDVRFVQPDATRKQLWDRLMMIGGQKPLQGALPPVTFNETMLCLAMFMRLRHGLPVILLDFSQNADGSLQVLSMMLSRRLHEVEIETEFDLTTAEGPLNSLVTLRCSSAVLSRPTALALRRFLLARGAAVPTAALGPAPKGAEELVVAVVRWEASLNVLEVLSRLPPAVRELILPC